MSNPTYEEQKEQSVRNLVEKYQYLAPGFPEKVQEFVKPEDNFNNC
jgi:hypothetical protein